MHHAVAREFSVFKSRNHPEHALLFAPFQPRLEADEIVHRARFIFLTQLNDRIRFFAGARVDQAHRLQRSECQRLSTARRENLHRETAFEYELFLKIV